MMLEKDASFPSVDMVLNLPLTLQSEFCSCLKHAKEVLSPILSIKEAVNCGKSWNGHKNESGSGPLKGSLSSVYGMVGSFVPETYSPVRNVHNSLGETLKEYRWFLVKDLRSSETILMACRSDQHLPIGFGWGAVVVIHKAILQLSADGKVIVKCIPSTLIEICCVGEDSFTRKCSHLSMLHLDQDECKYWEKERTTIHGILLSKFVKFSVPKLFKIRCRVVAVDKLLLERKKAENNYAVPSGNAEFKVKFVFLTLDDGTGLAKCSAQGEVAAILLNIPFLNSEKNVGTTEGMHLIKTMNNILRKHRNVLYCSVDCQQDPSGCSFMAHVAENQALDHSEKMFMHSFIVKACHSSPFDIIVDLQTHATATKKVREASRTELENTKNFSGLIFVAKKAEIARYETDMKATCKVLEDSLIKGVL